MHFSQFFFQQYFSAAFFHCCNIFWSFYLLQLSGIVWATFLLPGEWCLRWWSVYVTPSFSWFQSRSFRCQEESWDFLNPVCSYFFHPWSDKYMFDTELVTGESFWRCSCITIFAFLLFMKNCSTFYLFTFLLGINIFLYFNTSQKKKKKKKKPKWAGKLKDLD